MTKIPECYECGSALQPVVERMEIKIGQRAVTVEVEKLRCPACGASLFAPGQMAAAQRKASDEIRRQEGLLLPDELRAIRERHGLTQSALERMIGAGPKTVVRWESGLVFQQQTADALLRVLGAVPAAAEFLATLRGMSLGSSAPPIVLEAKSEDDITAEHADEKIIPIEGPRRAPRGRNGRSGRRNTSTRHVPVPAPVVPVEQLG